ncbi:hypothetical protein V1511DRAFT_513301 [Dipodascopsis uninucleata]
MSSGIGVTGNQGRCFQYWQELVDCSKGVKDGSKSRVECQLQVSDYMECLHHRKEVRYISGFADVIETPMSMM